MLFLLVESAVDLERVRPFHEQGTMNMRDEKHSQLLTVELQPLNEDVGMVVLAGEVDMSTASLLDDEFKAVAASDCSSLIIDASGVTFIDSTGLHSLIEGKRLVHEKGIQIYLVPSQQVSRLLELVFPESLFATRLETVEKALSELGLAP